MALSRESFAKCLGRAQDAGTFDENYVDSVQMNDIAFEKVQVKRANSTLEFLSDQTLTLKHLGLALASEPIRAMMRSLLLCSKSSSALDLVPPSLFSQTLMLRPFCNCCSIAVRFVLFVRSTAFSS